MSKIYDKNLVDLYNQQELEITYPMEGISTEDRIVGAIMGTMIGDALGLGSQWYYEPDLLWERYGTWITDYTNPHPKIDEYRMDEIFASRYKAGVRAGYNSQTGQLIQIVLETVAKNTRKNGQGEFVDEEYISAVNHFFEHDLLPKATFLPEENVFENETGTVATYAGELGGIMCYTGRYTNREVRENFDYWYNGGKKDGKWWSNEHNVSNTSTSDAAQMGVVLAGLYEDPKVLFYKAYDLVRMWYSDPAFITQAVAYICTVNAITNGVSLNDLCGLLDDIAIGLREMSKKVSSYDDWTKPVGILKVLQRPQLFPFPDDRFMPIAFGPDCHILNLLPAAYYYGYKYAHDFETGLLTAVNSGGNNMARAALTGGILGAMGGIQSIPQRLIDGLKNETEAIPEGYTSQGEYLLALAKSVAEGRH
jgi:ADP-ribosyl-[dinitrogen reductase] hydrolase